MRSIVKQRKKVDPNILFRCVWVSTLLALFLALPVVIIMYAIYSITGSILLGAIAGFAVRIIALMLVRRVSDYLTEMLD